MNTIAMNRSIPALLGMALVSASLAALLFTTSTARAAFPGANGKIAFHSNRDGNFEIYTINSDGTGTTRVTNNPADDLSSSWSADGTKIAFSSFRDGNYEIYKMNADGTGQTRLTNNAASDVRASWSPDGTKIAFSSDRDGNSEIYTMNADGTGQTRLTNNTALDAQPDWSPKGDKIAFVTNRGGIVEIYAMNTDGTSQTRIGSHPFDRHEPTWSPNGVSIAFHSRNADSPDRDLFDMPADGSSCCFSLASSAQEDIEPSYAPQNNDLAFATNRDGNYEIYTHTQRVTNNSALDSGPDWQPVARNYARPRSATPMRLPLVPAYAECGEPNTRHAGALTTPSCNPPRPLSQYLTLGTPDFNGQPSNAVGYVQIAAFCNGAPGESPPCLTTAGDQLDGSITVSQTDVRCQGTSGNCAGGPLSDYAGNLRFELTAVRITDRNSGGATGAATVADIPVAFNVACTPVGAGNEGSTCSATTSFDAVLGGTSVITEQKRAIWDLDDVKVYDGGADGNASTQGDNTVFAVDGMFFP